MLYLSGKGWTCHTCCPVSPYERIQNKTKGGADEIAYRMDRYANLKGITFEYPFRYTAFVLDDRTKKESFRNSLKVPLDFSRNDYQSDTVLPAGSVCSLFSSVNNRLFLTGSVRIQVP